MFEVEVELHGSCEDGGVVMEVLFLPHFALRAEAAGRDEDGVDEEQSISDSIYRIIVEGLMPEKYPCLLVIHYEKNFDRNNNYEILFFEFVYESDLKK